MEVGELDEPPRMNSRVHPTRGMPFAARVAFIRLSLLPLTIYVAFP